MPGRDGGAGEQDSRSTVTAPTQGRAYTTTCTYQKRLPGRQYETQIVTLTAVKQQPSPAAVYRSFHEMLQNNGTYNDACRRVTQSGRDLTGFRGQAFEVQEVIDRKACSVKGKVLVRDIYALHNGRLVTIEATGGTGPIASGDITNPIGSVPRFSRLEALGRLAVRKF